VNPAAYGLQNTAIASRNTAEPGAQSKASADPRHNVRPDRPQKRPCGLIGSLSNAYGRHDKAVAAVLAGISMVPMVTGVAAAHASEIDHTVESHDLDSSVASEVLFGNTAEASTEKFINVWANESHIDGPSDFQPISITHFDTDADGNIIGLSGPRVKIVFPEEIITELNKSNLSDALSSVAVNFDSVIGPTSANEFHFAKEDIALNGAATAFAATTSVADSMDKFAGHTVMWGNDGQLKVVPYKFVVNFFNAYFDGVTRELNLGALGAVTPEGKVTGMDGTPNGWANEVDNLLLDSARSWDVVAHEAGHAGLSGVKPGLFFGMSLAFNEGFADSITFLTALDDPDVVDRVLAETGGDLRKESEITRIAETVGIMENLYKSDESNNENYLRAIGKDITLDTLNLDRHSHELKGMGFRPDRNPHKVGQVISGISYDLFVSLYEEALADGMSAKDAIAHAKDTTGKLLVRSTRFVGEHSLSFRDVGVGMLHVDRDSFDGANRDILSEVLQKRGLLDAGENIDYLIDAKANKLPDYVLDAAVTEPDDVMGHVKAIEAKIVERWKSDSVPKDDKIKPLWHSTWDANVERIRWDKLSLYGDETSEDGYRTVRLRYDFDIPQLGGAFRLSDEPEEPYEAYISLVFDAEGKLVDAHNDKPEFKAF